MKTPLTALLALAAAVAALAPLARADEPAIIAKARAYLGGESALTAVQTLHFTGKIVQLDADAPDDPAKASTNQAEIFFEKPFRERIVVKNGGKVVETALDGFDGWQRSADPPEHTGQRLVLLGPAVTQNLRADTWENLNFYRGLSDVGGQVEDEGPATIDGIACEKVGFIHSPAIAYYRYFEQSTGRLVSTETGSGVRISEEGEIVAGGIRFPRTITTRQIDASGRVQISTYSFEKIAVNEPLADSLFTVPLGRTF